MKKRLLSILLVICTIATILPTFGGTAFAADTVTRSEWISRLVEAFSMTVESDDNMPDNYFSDLTEDDPHYRDILVAVEFGVIDLEAGEAFEPDAAATREFAAQTLNSCLMFQLDEGAEYTYSEADRVTYPDDIQIAVNRGWFALSGKSFLPEQAVTAAEADAMIADAKNIIAGDVIDENHENTYEFAAGVIEVPETVNAVIDADNTVTITDYDAQISEGDVFVVYSGGYPVSLRALNVKTSGNTTVISAEKDDSAIISADAEGSIDIDLENFEANELSTYSITNTETAESEEMSVELYSINYDKASKTLTASQKISMGSSAAGSVSVKLSNLKLTHKENVTHGDYMAYITADTTVTTAVSFDFGNYAGLPSSIKLGYVNIGGIGSISLDLDCSIKGGVGMSWEGKLKAGFNYTKHDGLRLEKEYIKTNFSFTAEAEIKAGLKLSAQINLAVMNGSIYGTIGIDVDFIYKDYDSGKPKTCETLKGYLYAKVGANVHIVGFGDVLNKSKDIFNEKNSPVRVYIHYEDSLPVDACTRGQNIKYTTKPTSKYYNPGPNHAQSSYGGGSSGGSGGSGGGSGEPYVLWEYTVDNGNATITGYNGTATAIAIPSKIDGYTVTKIGDNVFKNNNRVKSVTIADTVVEIGKDAFYNCSNLSNVQLSKNIETLKENSFGDCDSLTSIEIPKTLNVGGRGRSGSYIPSGAFNECDNLKDVTFEYGITKVPKYLFANCTGIENVSIPDTVTTIETMAFYMDGTFYKDKSKLKNIDLPESVTSIESYAFYGCNALSEIDLPDYIATIGESAFYNCSSLVRVKLPKYIDTLKENSFGDCDGLTSIEIPKTLNVGGRGRSGSYIPSGAFNECDNLKDVTFEYGITKVPKYLFANCTGIENVSIPDTVTTIETMAFYMDGTFYKDKSKLKNIDLPESVTSIESYAFYGCNALSEIDLPDYIATIGESAFYNCSSLVRVKLPKYIDTLKENSFGDCDGLTSIEIPKTLNVGGRGRSGSYIPSGAFNECDNLKDVTFEYGITKVPKYLFANCTGIENVSIPDTVTTIETMAFYMDGTFYKDKSKLKNIDLPESVTSIESYAFYGCNSLTQINIPKNLTLLDDYSFYNCTSLKEIFIPESVTSIGTSICYGCASLKKAVLPNKWIEIPSSMFYNCSSLFDVTLPQALKEIKKSAFYGCAALSRITLPEFLTDIGSNAFYASGLTEIMVPENVTSIGNSAFYNCDKLQTATIKGSGSIGGNAFYDCDTLTNLNISDRVTSIGSSLCYGCDKLTNVKIGNAITNISDSAFRQCPQLTKVQLPRFCTTVEANAFAEDVKLTDIYIPTSVTSIQTNSISYPNRTTGHGKSGSYGQAYANERGMNFEAVNAPITSIKYADSSMSIGRNATVRPQLNIEPAFDTSVVTFSTSDDKILTVSDTGLVRGVNYGTATITATADSGKSTSIEITVLKTATKLELDKSSLSLEQGQSDTLSVTMTPSDAADKLNWSSSNSEVATVDENGKITAVGVGTAVITVTAEYSSVSASCTVEVIKKATITASAGEHGKILPLGDASFPIGENATFNIIPDYGYVIKDVTVNGASVGAVESYTFSNISDNATIHAEFAAVNVSYGNGDVVISSEAALNNLTLIIAEYNSDNSLSNCEVRTITAEPNAEQHVSVSPTGKYKIMLWSGFDIMRPIWMYQG